MMRPIPSFSTVRLVVTGVLAMAVTAPAEAREPVVTGLTPRMTAAHPGSLASTNVVDLSAYQTSSREQEPLGSCTAFSLIAALEAAYTHEYCDDPESQFALDGYCQRHAFLKGENLAPFALLTTPQLGDNLQQLDLSELYFIHRVLTSWTPAPYFDHASGGSIVAEGIERELFGNAHFLVDALTVPEEASAPYIHSPEFYGYQRHVLFEQVTQEKIDQIELADTQYRFPEGGASTVRAYIPSLAREQARFGFVRARFLRGSDLVDLIGYLERALYEGYEVALDGAIPGHSMLLVGYDRVASEFLFKDHYQCFRTETYADIVSRKPILTLTIIEEVRPYPGGFSKQEMWLGQWNLAIGGVDKGHLVLRTVRIPPNALYTTADAFAGTLAPSDTSKWVRAGTFYRNHNLADGFVVYARLAPPRNSNLLLYIDYGRKETYSADPIATIAAGYGKPLIDPAGQMGLAIGYQASGRVLGEGYLFGTGQQVRLTRRILGGVTDVDGIEARNLLAGRVDGDPRSDLVVWKSGWSQLPTHFLRFPPLAIATTTFPLAGGDNLINTLSFKLAGDFDADGRLDIALWNHEFWNWTAVYFSNGDGTYRITNVAHAGDENRINSFSRKLVGDFDGDGRSDIALVGSGWQSTPVYFSAGDGTFAFTNLDHPAGKRWINESAARTLVGDFDGDGRSDVAVWKPTFASTPIYHSTGTGSFSITNVNHASGKNWINDQSAGKLVGDFNGDGKSDIAVWKSGWQSTPVYFSNGGGSFTVTNVALPVGMTWINDPGAAKLLGDFNGDGRTDIALWKYTYGSTPVYFSKGDGSFTIANYTHASGKNLINSSATVKLVADWDGDGRSDILLRVKGSSCTPIYLASITPGQFIVSQPCHSAGQNYLNQ